MSRFGANKGRKLPGAEFSWDTEAGGEPDTAPTPLYPKYNVTRAMLLSPCEQLQVDLYRQLRERFHEGPYYSVLDSASSSAKKGSAARTNYDPFHGMPSYAGRYQKKKRTLPKLQGRQYIMKFFPRELWQTIQPSFKPDTSMDGYVPQVTRAGAKRGFEDEEEEEENLTKRRKGAGAGEDEDEGEGGGEGEIPDPEDEEAEEEIVDSDFEDDDDEMGGDYNAEQYFDDGGDEYGDDGFGDGGGGGGEEDTF